MNIQLLNAFARWFSENQNVLLAAGATAILSTPSTNGDKPGQYADIDVSNGYVIGRITLWASGECDMEALDSTSEQQILWKHVHIASECDLDTHLRAYFATLKH